MEDWMADLDYTVFAMVFRMAKKKQQQQYGLDA